MDARGVSLVKVTGVSGILPVPHQPLGTTFFLSFFDMRHLLLSAHAPNMHTHRGSLSPDGKTSISGNSDATYRVTELEHHLSR